MFRDLLSLHRPPWSRLYPPITYRLFLAHLRGWRWQGLVLLTRTSYGRRWTLWKSCSNFRSAIFKLRSSRSLTYLSNCFWEIIGKRTVSRTSNTNFLRLGGSCKIHFMAAIKIWNSLSMCRFSLARRRIRTSGSKSKYSSSWITLRKWLWM